MLCKYATLTLLRTLTLYLQRCRLRRIYWYVYYDPTHTSAHNIYIWQLKVHLTPFFHETSIFRFNFDRKILCKLIWCHVQTAKTPIENIEVILWMCDENCVYCDLHLADQLGIDVIFIVNVYNERILEIIKSIFARM